MRLKEIVLRGGEFFLTSSATAIASTVKKMKHDAMNRVQWATQSIKMVSRRKCHIKRIPRLPDSSSPLPCIAETCWGWSTTRQKLRKLPVIMYAFFAMYSTISSTTLQQHVNISKITWVVVSSWSSASRARASMVYLIIANIVIISAAAQIVPRWYTVIT